MASTGLMNGTLLVLSIATDGNTFYNLWHSTSSSLSFALDTPEATSKDSGGYMNSFELGPECARRLKKALKEININWKDYLIENKKEKTNA